MPYGGRCHCPMPSCPGVNLWRAVGGMESAALKRLNRSLLNLGSRADIEQRIRSSAPGRNAEQK